MDQPVPRLELLKFMPFRLNRLATEVSSDLAKVFERLDRPMGTVYVNGKQVFYGLDGQVRTGADNTLQIASDTYTIRITPSGV